MVLGVSFFAFLTATVTSTVTQRAGVRAQEDERSHEEQNTQTILDALSETRKAIADLEARLARMESGPTG
jgi:hypothetical protein